MAAVMGIIRCQRSQDRTQSFQGGATTAFGQNQKRIFL
ncbi:hypothetical protein ALQ32_102348 [Pseudomonas syringae pv. tagetis]|uniref:Uncharacterized protein n=1 Tax=Pseudomonas syringae pv. tagetis TaxID=129140 RepID=A0A3M3Z1S7_9PSED|nr:hypothetical protein ALQ32_102348 [Pseudomonas syringae pv. tagetis]RMU95242.1 hypothetical protein ALP19_102553 [Pseudomonas syringae pv. tomato]